MKIDQSTDFKAPHIETVEQWAPPVAPLAMPRQQLENPAGKGLIDQLVMFLFPREHI